MLFFVCLFVCLLCDIEKRVQRILIRPDQWTMFVLYRLFQRVKQLRTSFQSKFLRMFYSFQLLNFIDTFITTLTKSRRNSLKYSEHLWFFPLQGFSSHLFDMLKLVLLAKGPATRGSDAWNRRSSQSWGRRKETGVTRTGIEVSRQFHYT
jgi:hypothetical protein